MITEYAALTESQAEDNGWKVRVSARGRSLARFVEKYAFAYQAKIVRFTTVLQISV